MRVDENLIEILSRAVAAVGYRLWGAELAQSGHKPTLRVYIDKSAGVSVDDCGKASHQINTVLEAEQNQFAQYVLEVSSPGIFRPLFTHEQYQQYVGQPIKLRLRQANELNRKNFSGILQSVEAESIIMEVDKEKFSFKMSDIAEAHLNPDIFTSKSKVR